MYNITEIERTYFDMLVYQGTTVFKAAFHMSSNMQTYELGAFKQDESLLKIKIPNQFDHTITVKTNSFPVKVQRRRRPNKRFYKLYFSLSS